MATKPLAPIEASRLERYKTHYGLLTSSAALQLSLESNQFAKDCGPDDPAFLFFVNDTNNLFSYAELLEREENLNKE